MSAEGYAEGYPRDVFAIMPGDRPVDSPDDVSQRGPANGYSWNPPS